MKITKIDLFMLILTIFLIGGMAVFSLNAWACYDENSSHSNYLKCVATFKKPINN